LDGSFCGVGRSFLLLPPSIAPSNELPYYYWHLVERVHVIVILTRLTVVYFAGPDLHVLLVVPVTQMFGAMRRN
jgi:hypothetical protein